MPQTAAQIAQMLGGSLDVLRAMLRADPALRSLGVMLGNQRVYREGDVQKIREAWASRRDRRRKSETVGA